MSGVLANEVRQAESVLASLHLQWYGETRRTADSIEARAEAGFERFCIEVEGAAPARPGLVSVLTSDTRRSRPVVPFDVQASSAAVRALLGAFVPEPGASRLARLRRSVGAAARCVGALIAPTVETWRTVMVTLTYRGTNADWQPRDITAFIKTARAWFARRDLPFRYVWVAELQKRGVIHYHVALWLPQGVDLPKPDEAGWWPHGMTRIETARHAVGYLMKYLSKGNEATKPGGFPQGARVHGRGGLGEQFRAVIRWLALPAFVQARASVDDRWQRVPGGGWADPSGEWWPSEFERVSCGHGYALRRVHDHGRPFEASGPFSWVPACS